VDGTGTLHSVFLTGGTGFLGSYLAASLLGRGSQVTFLARPGKRLSAEDRVGQILDWHEVSPVLRRNVRVVTGDVIQPGLGIGAGARRSLVDAFDGIIHCASNTSFVEKEGEVTAANVGGICHILYGHSQTVRTLQFNTLYYPIKTAYRLRKLYEADNRERGGDRAKEMGVRLDPDGTLYLPVRIEVCEGPGLNLIPVDYFVAATLAIMGGAPEGGIHHLVNEAPVSLATPIDYTKAHFRLLGVEACPSTVSTRRPQTPWRRPSRTSSRSMPPTCGTRVALPGTGPPPSSPSAASPAPRSTGTSFAVASTMSSGSVGPPRLDSRTMSP